MRDKIHHSWDVQDKRVTVDTGHCIHALNTVYIPSLERWIRLDARGNKDGVNAQISLDEEILSE